MLLLLLVSRAKCSRKFRRVVEKCSKDGFENIVEEISNMTSSCRDWVYDNADDIDPILSEQFRCIIGNERNTIIFITLSISLGYLFFSNLYHYTVKIV